MGDILPMALKLIKFHEGYMTVPYKDTSGYSLWTWGYGWCLDTRRPTADEWAGMASITNDTPTTMQHLASSMDALRSWLTRLDALRALSVADLMLRSTIARLLPEIETNLGFWPDLDDVRQVAIVDMAYNMGMAGLLQFKLTLGQFAQGNYITAGTMLLDSQYAKDVGQRAVRISNMIKTGEWPAEVKLG